MWPLGPTNQKLKDTPLLPYNCASLHGVRVITPGQTLLSHFHIISIIVSKLLYCKVSTTDASYSQIKKATLDFVHLLFMIGPAGHMTSYNITSFQSEHECIGCCDNSFRGW